MTTGLIGARPGRCSPARWPIFGTPGQPPAASRPARKSFGPKTTSRSAAAITTASTSRAGTWCARVAPRLGSATILRRRCGKNLKSETGHGTQKPVECMRRPIENHASPGQAVYEPFSGSGTTIIAAEMTGRVCHAIEIAPAYVDVAVKRWQEFTGQQAVLDGDGRSFDNVAVQRAR